MVTSPQTDAAPDVAAAEAAAWLARLQGPQRTEAAEAAFKVWLKADPAHPRAFARATDAWELALGAARLRTEKPAPKPRLRVATALALAACLAVAVSAALIMPRAGTTTYDTAAGEQRTVILSDNTRVALNTNSRLAVDYRPGERRVRLERGEAMFYVAHNPARPFIVSAGDEQIRALGTTFIVRRDATKTSVTLVEGRVAVSEAAPIRLAKPRQLAVLAPGERLVLQEADVKAQAAVLDRPKVETVTAWRRGQVIFDDTPLSEAALELNRYGGSPLHLATPSLGRLRISGVFETNNPAEFANAVSQLYGLSVRNNGEGLVLTQADDGER